MSSHFTNRWDRIKLSRDELFTALKVDVESMSKSKLWFDSPLGERRRLIESLTDEEIRQLCRLKFWREWFIWFWFDVRDYPKTSLGKENMLNLGKRFVSLLESSSDPLDIVPTADIGEHRSYRESYLGISDPNWASTNILRHLSLVNTPNDRIIFANKIFVYLDNYMSVDTMKTVTTIFNPDVPFQLEEYQCLPVSPMWHWLALHMHADMFVSLAIMESHDEHTTLYNIFIPEALGYRSECDMEIYTRVQELVESGTYDIPIRTRLWVWNRFISTAKRLKIDFAFNTALIPEIYWKTILSCTNKNSQLSSDEFVESKLRLNEWLLENGLSWDLDEFFVLMVGNSSLINTDNRQRVEA